MGSLRQHAWYQVGGFGLSSFMPSELCLLLNADVLSPVCGFKHYALLMHGVKGISNM
jgi:hypothetical protein